MNTREELTRQLSDVKKWDIIIIGGGATGLGIALDAATRGFKTLLMEQSDFAKGTSSKATKLVHGGVRYMAQGDFSLVKEACKERGLLLQNAPHITANEAFVIPIYRYSDCVKYTVGLKVYDFLAGNLSLGKSTFLNKTKVIAALPLIRRTGLKGGVLYHDGQFDDARLALNIAQTAVENGACVLNYFKITELLKDNHSKVNGIIAQDQISHKVYQLYSKIVINATGVYADNILQLDNAENRHLVRPSQGVHLVLDKSFLPGENALMIPSTPDGRVLFAVPWYNKIIVGTTDTLRDTPELEPKALDKEIVFILKTAGDYLTKKPAKTDILSIFAGLRPLAAPKDDSKKTKEISRSHKIIISSSDLITIIGGKWTTFRRMAQDTVNKVEEVLHIEKRTCITEHLKIHGYKKTTKQKLDFVRSYGTDMDKIELLSKIEPGLSNRLIEAYPYTEAMVVWAARNEYAFRVEDILARRMRLLFLDTKAALKAAPTVARILAAEHGHDPKWIEDELADFRRLAEKYQSDTIKD